MLTQDRARVDVCGPEGVEPPTPPSALTMAGYLLGVTRHIAVGTAVSVLSTQHPVAMAEQVLLLDQLSRGRLRLGVGRGGPWIDQLVFEPFGRRAGLAEALDLLLDALTGDEVRGDGPAFDFPAVSVVPGPHTRPRPPVVLAATTPASVELAAGRRLPLLLGMHADDAEKAAAVSRYADLVGVGGAPAGHLSAGVSFVADSDEQATATIRRHLPRWLGPGLAGYRRAEAPRTIRGIPTSTPSCCAGCTRWVRLRSAGDGSPGAPGGPASIT